MRRDLIEDQQLREISERTEMLREMAKSPELAGDLFGDWCSTHSPECIGNLVLQMFAQIALKGESALIQPAALSELWKQTIEPVIDLAAKHEADI